MLFNTLSYVVFLSIIVALFWLLPPARRTWLVLFVSIIFYGLWRAEFVLLITFSAFVDYFFSLKIYDEAVKSRRRLWLLISLCTNLGLLLYFKYTYFLLNSASELSARLGWDWSAEVGRIVLPLGFSFYTFLSISYTLDV